MGVDCATHSGKQAADNKCEQFRVGHIDTHRFRRGLILTHRQRSADVPVGLVFNFIHYAALAMMIGQVTGFETADNKLTEIKVTGADGVTRRLPLDDLLVFFGLKQNLGPLANWGLELDRKAIKVDTEKFQSNIPGVYAIGDINTYPGKKKLILSGFHEAALMAQAAFHICKPNEKLRFQYTTSSSNLQKKLGVS